MYPYLNVGPVHLGTFGLLLWLAAVAATLLLQRSFTRDGVNGDALNVVAMVVIAGILGAKAWHELQDPAELFRAMHQIGYPGWHHPVDVVLGFLRWFQAGFAWFGGLFGGIGMLMLQGRSERPNGLTGSRAAIRMLDLAAPAAALGYGIGRLGCLTSGDGDYGRNTTGWYGVHMAPNALVPPNPPNALVLPTPLYEFAAALVIAYILYRLAGRSRPLGWLTGVYLILTGVERFTVEFWRINPKLYFGMSNAQTAALGSIIVGAVIWAFVRSKTTIGGPVVQVEPAAHPA